MIDREGGIHVAKKLFVLIVCSLGVGSCTSDEPSSPHADVRDDRPEIYTVNYPLAYFAERIAGDSASVVFPAPADVDPATWSPGAEIVAAYQRADLILLNGAGYADWVERVSLSQSRRVDTSAAIEDRLIPVAGEVTHSHGPGGEHSHQDTAFTTWLDLELAIAQARAVSDALVVLRPELEADYRERTATLEQDLNELDGVLREVAVRIGDAPLLFSHPVYQYLIQGYGLNGNSVHWEPQDVPEEGQWQALSSRLVWHPAAWIVWEDEPHPDTVSRLEKMGVGSLVFRPSGNRPDGHDFLSMMQENVRALEQAIPAAHAPSRAVE